MDLRLLQDGGAFQTPLWLVRADKCTSKIGTQYIDGDCLNKYGAYRFKIWNADTLEELELNTPYLVNGKVNIFNQTFGIVIDRLEALTEYKEEDFLPSVDTTEDEMKSRISAFIAYHINKPSIKEFVISIMNDYYPRFLKHPASRTMHDALVGGLAYHTCKVTEYALSMCKQYPNVNKDLVIAGSLLHDIGKIEEFTPLPNAEYTVRGNLEGHLAIGLDILSNYQDKIEYNDYLQLRHIIASHHGKLEWGAIRKPLTPEAMIVHQADVSDSSITRCLEKVKEGTMFPECVSVVRGDEW